MLLAIDVGNSHTVFGLFRNETLLHHWRIKTDRERTADELAGIFHGLFSLRGLAFGEVKSAILASVVPTQQRAWQQFAAIGDWPLLQVNDPRLETGLSVCTDSPSEVGADRIVNSVAAFARYRSPLIVVDFGTAITFDCVSKNCEYLGGAITPGLAIAHDALASRTAKLPRVDFSCPPAKAMGTNTRDAIKSGMLFGYGGLVDGLVKRLCLEFPDQKPRVVATGGMAEVIAPCTASIEAVHPMLTLEGLQILFAKNEHLCC